MIRLGAARRRGVDRDQISRGRSPGLTPTHVALLLRPLYPSITELEAAAYAVGVAGRPAAEVDYPESEDLWRDAGIELAYILGCDGDGS